MIIIINLIGLVAIVAIVFWFWIMQPKKYYTKANQVDILVKDGVYTPANINVPINTSFTLRFLRKDPSSCAEVVIFPALNINKHLPLNQQIDIEINIKDAGVYEFTCQMGMYRGKLFAQ